VAKKKPKATTPPEKRVERFGGSFAPPLTDDLLERYEAAAAKAPRMEKETLEGLIQMARTFRETGPSKLKAHPHPAGVGTLTKLEQEEVDRIDPVVPWQHEVDALKAMAEKVQVAEADRNAVKAADWTRRVKQVVVEKHFGDQSGLEYALTVIRSEEAWKAAGLVDDGLQEKIDDLRGKIHEATDEANECVRTKECEGVPYPELEDTTLRTGLFHLIWLAQELTEDREPLTNDQL
jgi:hypothetical protein